MAGDVAQIIIRPCGQDFAVKPRLVALAIPAKPKAIAIGLGLGLFRMKRLMDQAVVGF